MARRGKGQSARTRSRPPPHRNTAEHFLAVLKKGTVSTNAFLRKTHNFALDLNWLPTVVIPRRQWATNSIRRKASGNFSRALEDHRSGDQSRAKNIKSSPSCLRETRVGENPLFGAFRKASRPGRRGPSLRPFH